MRLTPAAQRSAYQSHDLPEIIGQLIRVNRLPFLVGWDVHVPQDHRWLLLLHRGAKGCRALGVCGDAPGRDRDALQRKKGGYNPPRVWIWGSLRPHPWLRDVKPS